MISCEIFARQGPPSQCQSITNIRQSFEAQMLSKHPLEHKKHNKKQTTPINKWTLYNFLNLTALNPNKSQSIIAESINSTLPNLSSKLLICFQSHLADKVAHRGKPSRAAHIIRILHCPFLQLSHQVGFDVSWK